VIYRLLRTAFTLGLSIFLAACSQPAVQPPGPEALLRAVPPADSAQYDRIQDMKKWRNPYLIVRADGVALLDAGDNAEIAVKPEEVIAELARLPVSNWPYGRVVAAAESGVRASEQDGVAIRRNKGIVGGLLQSAHIAVKWVPSA
jgi:hypothetical protein